MIEIPALKEETIRLKLVGLSGSPLVTCPFSEKEKEAIRDKQAGGPRQKKGAKDTEAEFQRHRYIIDDGPHKGRDGFPNILIKHSITDACSFVAGATKVHVRGCIYVGLGQHWLAPIDSPPPKKREDRVMVNGMAGRGSGSADLRYRPEYSPWSITVDVTYDSTLFSAATVVNLLRVAGRRVGIGEWRAQKGGQWGMFDVESAAMVQDVEEAAE